MMRNVLLISLLALSACNPLGAPKPADALYVLQSSTKKSEMPPLPKTIKIAMPDAAPGLESSNIALLDGHRINHYTGAAWAVPLPQTVQHFLADSLERSGRFLAVGTDSEGITTDDTLLTDIRDWQVEGGTEPKVHVRAVLKMTQSGLRMPWKTVPFEITVPASANRTEAIVDAFNQAANGLAATAIEVAGATSPLPLEPARTGKSRRAKAENPDIKPH